MASYNVSKVVNPTKTMHRSKFFCYQKQRPVLYCSGLSFKKKLRNFKPAAGTVISVLGNSTALPFKQSGNDCIIDLSGLQSNEISAELYVIKLKNAL